MLYNKNTNKTDKTPEIISDQKSKLITLSKLFISFLKIGAFTFGSGFSMIPIVQREFAEKNHMFKESEISDIMAISQSLPGSIAVNAAALIGYQSAGKTGAFFSALGVVLPSFCLIFVLSFFLKKIENIQAVQYAFTGIRAGVLALIIKALFEMTKQCPRNIMFYIISASAFAAVVLFGVNVFAVVVCSAATGLTAAFITDKKGLSP